MRNAMVAAFAALASMSTTVYAADMYGGSAKDAPEAYEAPVGYSWAGLYIGGSVGFGVGDTSGTLQFDDYKEYDQPTVSLAREVDIDERGGFGDFISALLSSDYDVNGAIYGAHLGYNFQRGNMVYGVELGLNGTNMDGSDRCFSSLLVVATCERELEWYATAVGRLGYASGKTLFYGFGGVAWGEVKTDIAIDTIFGGVRLSGEETHVGWTAGVGIEHAFTDRFSARIEYSHVDLGEEDHSLGYGIKSKVDLEFDAIKIGASYKLFGDHAPLEAMK